MRDLIAKIRPSNMRITTGLRVVISVSAAECVEETLSDPNLVRESGSGMDAPEWIPAGSVKAWFEPPRMRNLIGFCQREVKR